jgi:hypothetical protein
VQVHRSSSSSHDNRGSSIGTVHLTFTLPSAVVSLLPLNQHPFSSALPCPFDGDTSFQSVGWHCCDQNDEDEHWGCSGCRHLVGLQVKGNGVYNILAFMVCEKDVCENLHTTVCRILVVGRHQNAEGNNNASSLPCSSSDGK